MIRSLFLFPLLIVLVSCGQVSGGDPPTRGEPAPGGLLMGSAPQPWHGPPHSTEEKMLLYDTIVVAYWRSSSADILLDTDPARTGEDNSYRVMLRFEFSASQYLQGSGPRDITVVWIDSTYYETRAEAESVRDIVDEARDAQWDNQVDAALLFVNKFSASANQETRRTVGTELQRLLQRDDYFSLRYEGVYYPGDDGYSLHSNVNRAWLPSAPPPDCPSGSCSYELEFMTAPPPSEDTITFNEVRQTINKVNAELNNGDGSPEYADCVGKKYEIVRNRRGWPAYHGQKYTHWQLHYTIESGLPTGARLDQVDYRLDYYPTGYDPVWLTGEDARLFAVATSTDKTHSGMDGSHVLATARPLPGGEYTFEVREKWPSLETCDFAVVDEALVSITDHSAALHEFLFDPVTDGDSIAADDNVGVLKPINFTGADGADASLSRLDWATSTVTLTVRPASALLDMALDVVELDGSVSLTLNYSDASVNSASSTLSWDVSAQPWHDGDMLMIRVHRQFPPPPSSVDTWTVAWATVVDWSAVDGAAHYAVEWRAPGGLDEWENTSLRSAVVGEQPPATTTAVQLWFSPTTENLRCAATREFRVRSFGDGASYAAGWGKPSAVATEPGTVCNALPEFGVASYSFSIAEDAPVGAPVGTATATDFDATDTPVHSITAGNDDGKFAIDAGTGEITVAGALDRSVTPSYALRVTASDGRTVNGVPGERTVPVSIAVTEPLAEVGAPVLAGTIRPRRANLSWGAVEGAAKYRVRYALSGEDWTTARERADTTRAITGLDRGALFEGNTYDFQVQAYGDGELRKAQWGDWSNTYTATNGPPPTPTNLEVVGTATSSATVAWDRLEGVTRFHLKYKTVYAPWVYIAEDVPSGTSTRIEYTVASLEPGRGYLLQVGHSGDGTRYLGEVNHNPRQGPWTEQIAVNTPDE